MELTIRTLDDEDDYELALEEINALWEARKGSRAHAERNALIALVEAYEAEHHPIAPPDPIEAIEFHLEQQGLDETDLEGVIGNRARVWEVMNGRRPLTLQMIRRLHQELGIPADALIGV